MERLLINTDLYNSKYVAMADAEDNTIVGYGDTPDEALREAREKGFENPFLIYVPDKGVVQIYYAG